MFTPEDIREIKEKGITLEEIEQQMRNFATGFPFLQITGPAEIHRGLVQLTDDEIQKYISVFEQEVTDGLIMTKFVPASGAATRMFKSLFEALESLNQGKTEAEVLINKEVQLFHHRLSDFAFFEELRIHFEQQNKNITQVPLKQILEALLLPEGLNYGSLPKGLLLFHSYDFGKRTPLEEHLVEGAQYAQDRDGTVRLHFTVSPEHFDGFSNQLQALKNRYEQELNVQFEIGFSTQKPSTDTVAATPANELFRNGDGKLLFRPAGHGALLENLNDLNSDLIYIKNIDNVVPDHFREATIRYKKALAGMLLNIRKQIFYYQQMVAEHHPASLESAFYAEAANFLENILNIKPPANQYYSEKEELYHYFRQKFFRPIRVCGMVKNQGEPGGGPFFARNRDGSVSLQIAESSQIDFQNPEQAAHAKNASHFNPVDLVCSVNNFRGEKYHLPDFRDPETGFISVKSQNGKTLKAQELPGLWNGAMSDWNTIFVEVPLETFNPVKTVIDLLRKEHQAKA